jgi:hypothetical protein
VNRATRTVLHACALLAAISCSPDSQPLTQVMVVVDSDMAQIDSVRVRVDGMGDTKLANANDLDKHPLPRTIAIVYRGGPLGPITVTAEALDSDATTLVSRRAQFSFARGRNVTLELELQQSCIAPKCDLAKQTCIAGACKSPKVDTSKLSDWTGDLPNQSDAGIDGDGGEDSGIGMGGGAATGGSAGAPSGGKGGQSAGAGGKPAAGSGGTAGVMSTCTGGCAFDSATTAPHGQLACENSACVLHCDAGYTNADLNNANGCEMMASAFSWKVSNVDPKNAALLGAIVPALPINCSGTLDLGSGTLPASVTICGTPVAPVLITQASGPDLVAFATRNMIVASGSTFRFGGSRPVAFVVYGDAEIDGQLDVSATGSSAGPGSNFACAPGAGGSGANGSHAGGGGGGGFGTKGGDGASSTPSGAAGGLGGAVSLDASLSPLRGGCSGGAGGKGDGGNAAGGGGGGAIQLSVAGKLRIGGTIAAAGGGGRRSDDETGLLGDGGGGGGSGGAILLEATTIETASASWMTTNGGGGGEGRVAFYTSDPGADGAHSSADPAPGGSGPSSGGNGAAADAVGSAAPACSYSLCGGGGGGGGLGRVVLRATDCSLAGSANPQAMCSLHPN